MSSVRARGRLVAAAIAALVVAAAAGLGLTLRNERVAPAPWPESERPELLVLTSLPIVFPESFSLDAPASPALKALQGRYRLRPISLPDRASLGGGRLLLMAQPRAQPAEVLVELDQWVRGGGRVLLLADPLLEWPSERPLGDVLRPPLAFADTGLLGHWGLRLDSPDKPGPAVIDAGGFRVEARSPGSLVATGSQCRVEADGLLARCRIGKGEATVIADADLLGPKTRENQEQNLGLVLAELERIER